MGGKKNIRSAIKSIYLLGLAATGIRNKSSEDLCGLTQIAGQFLGGCLGVLEFRNSGMRVQELIDVT